MTPPAGPLLEEMTWPEVRDAAAAGLPVVLPVGATEQHGPHLPLNTDCLIPVGDRERGVEATAARDRAADQVRGEIAPLSGGGETFPGTLSLAGHTLIDTLRDVLGALARSGFTRICLQNWHYENSGYLWEASDLAAERHPGVRIRDPRPSVARVRRRAAGRALPAGISRLERRTCCKHGNLADARTAPRARPA